MTEKQFELISNLLVKTGDIFSEGYRRYLALGFTSFVRTYVRKYALTSVSVYAFFFFCLNDQAYNCLIHFYKRGIIMFDA